MILRGAQVGGELSFAGATLDEESQLGLDLEGVDVRILDLRFAAMPASTVSLRDARVARLRDKRYPGDRWPRCELDGCRYETLDAEPAEPPVSVKDRLAWLARDPDHYAPQPYEQLAGVYRAHGDESAAREVAIEKERRRRQQLRGPAWVWNLFLGATVGHGYRLWFAGVWLLALVAVGSLVFGEVFDAGASDDLTPAKSAEAPFQPVIYTVDALVPVLSLGQETSWNAHGAAQWTTAALTILGWLLTTALVAGIAARRQ